MFLTSSLFWAQTQIGENVFPTSETDDELFGSAIALNEDGTSFVASSPFWTHPTLGQNTGKAEVFEFSSPNWQPKGTAIEGTSALSGLGIRANMTTDGSTVIVGAPFHNTSGYPRRGKVAVYKYFEGNGWLLYGQELFGDDAGVRFGSGVGMSMNGNKIVAGAHQYDTATLSDCGLMRAYEFNTALYEWQQIGSDIIGANGDRFGLNVTMSKDGNRIMAFSENGNNAAGYVRVYQLVNNEWVQIGNDIIGENPGDKLGFSMQFTDDGTRIALGSRTYNNGDGMVKVFDYNGTDWVQVGNTLAGSGQEAFGTSLALSSDGTFMVIGAPSNSENGDIGQGKVRFYKLLENLWTEVGNPIAHTVPNITIQTGTAVALSDNNQVVAIGSVFYPLNDTVSPGMVEVYDIVDVLGAEDIDSQNGGISIYPTQTAHTIYIKNNTSQVKEVIIYDSTGSRVKSLSEVHDQIDVSELPVGVYFLSLMQGNNSTKTFQFIKK